MTEAHYPQSQLSREIDARAAPSKRNSEEARAESWTKRKGRKYKPGDGEEAAGQFRSLAAVDIVGPLCELLGEVMHPRPFPPWMPSLRLPY